MSRCEEIEWCNVWITSAPSSTLPRVLLVGDSITQSYYTTVETELAGKYSCARLATSRSICDPVFRRELDLVLADYRYAAIHFNNGLHGWAYSEAAYAAALPPILDTLSAAGRVIWASTTPMRNPSDLNTYADTFPRIRERNQIAATAATARQIPINDLFTLAEAHPEYYSQDGVHFQESGMQAAGRQVARMIQHSACQAS
ncbi:MAG: hypothetical protein PCFJNLEI_00598 [Verrucomicrobiae bacterium]|nr:hypothetical protein [Verrucomicrobiae bacterium]